MTKSIQAIDLFYPIVPDCAWLARLLPLGVKTVQLRLKNSADSEIRREVLMAVKLASTYDAALIINDYWQAAIDAGAAYIHLGQEDLAAADLQAIRQAGLKFGVSTHSEAELAKALAASPDYVALGPIYETKLKAMPWAPQGLQRVAQWKTLAGNMPLIAIGGLTLDRADAVLQAGADSVAVITDFITHANPEERVALWVKWADAKKKGASPMT